MFAFFIIPALSECKRPNGEEKLLPRKVAESRSEI